MRVMGALIRAYQRSASASPGNISAAISIKHSGDSEALTIGYQDGRS